MLCKSHLCFTWLSCAITGKHSCTIWSTTSYVLHLEHSGSKCISNRNKKHSMMCQLSDCRPSSSFLASSLSSGANKEPSGFPCKLLLLPQVPRGVKESLHLRRHRPVPRRKPKQYPIGGRQLRRRNLWYVE
uniref:Secreted protein n=1 Tax=Glycine max TaxID=3847 RepID=C6TNJ6_SOYBN|nr:unknown [Glycine max]